MKFFKSASFLSFILLLSQWGSLSAQDEPVGVLRDIPMVEPETEAREHEDRQLLWKLQSANRALESGLASIAEGLYAQLASEMPEDDPRIGEVHLNWLSTLISLGRLEQAAELEASVDGVDTPGWQLRQALLAFFGDDSDGAEELMQGLDEARLPERDRPWFFLMRGLLSRDLGQEGPEVSFFDRARDLAGSPEMRAQLDLIIFRNLLLRAEDLDDTHLTRLKMESESNAGNRLGLQFAKEYAIALYTRGQVQEANQVINSTLATVRPEDLDLRDELLFLQGLILGSNTPAGISAFRQLVASGVDRELQGLALSEWLEVVQGDERIEGFIEFTRGLQLDYQGHPLADRLLFHRAELLYESGDYPSAENDAQLLLERFPNSDFEGETLKLLVQIAFHRQRYRTAAGYLIRIGERGDVVMEDQRINLLVADCFFLAKDYENAAASYAAAYAQAMDDRGAILFQWVIADLRSGRLDDAIEHLQAASGDQGLDPVQRWKAEWNVLTQLQRVGRTDDAYRLMMELLDDTSYRQLPLSLRLRLQWFHCQLSLFIGDYASTEQLAEEILSGVSLASSEAVSESLQAELMSLTQVLSAQAKVFLGSQEAGLALFERVRNDYPESRAAAQSYLAEARYYATQNRRVEAQQLLINLADRYPDSELAPLALYEASLHALARGLESTTQEANQILSRLSSSYPDHPLKFYGRLTQANLLRTRNEFGLAENVYETLLQEFPNHPDRPLVLLALGESLLAQPGNLSGRIDKAIGIFERLIESTDVPEDLRVEAAYKWGFAYERRELPERKMQIYWMAVDRFLLEEQTVQPLGPTGRYWLSRMLFELASGSEAGDTREAARLYQFIIDHQLPGVSMANARLAQLNPPQS